MRLQTESKGRQKPQLRRPGNTISTRPRRTQSRMNFSQKRTLWSNCERGTESRKTTKWCLVSKACIRILLSLLYSTALSPKPFHRPVRHHRRVARRPPPRTPGRSRDIPRALARALTDTGSKRRTQKRHRGPGSPELHHTRDTPLNRSGFHTLPARLAGAPEEEAGAAAGISSTMTPPGVGRSDTGLRRSLRGRCSAK